MIKRAYVVRKHVAALLLYIHCLSITLPALASNRNSYVSSTTQNVYNTELLRLNCNEGTTPSKGSQSIKVRSEKKKNKECKEPIVYQSGKKFRKISGPTQPEMTSFQSVNTDNMVNLFTGDFSYSIPLGDVGGYPLNLFYNAGITMDQEASWTGLGWNLNPGTITRNMRGIPDDFDGGLSGGADKITKEQYVKPNITVGLSLDKNYEVLGSDRGGTSILPKQFAYQVGVGINYNNYTGLGVDLSGDFSYSFKGIAHKIHDEKNDSFRTTISLGANLSSKTRLRVNPSLSVSLFKSDGKSLWGAMKTSASISSSKGVESFGLDFQRTYHMMKPALELKGAPNMDVNPGFTMNFAKQAYTPSIRMPLSYLSFPLTVKIGTEKLGIAFKNTNLSGYYQQSYISEKNRIITKPAYGYLQLQNANGKGDALLDFNRLNDVEYIEQVSPAISIPQYTYDIFSISGEGTGGSFRAYRPDVGYVRDAHTKSSNTKASLGLNFGAGSDIKFGADISGVLTPTFVGEWSDKNLAKDNLQFQESKGSYQPAYFKNPGEKTISSEDYYHAIGDDKLVRLELINYDKSSPSAYPNLVTYNEGNTFQDAGASLPLKNAIDSRLTNRDKRSQVISYLNADEASKVGLETQIKSYAPFRKAYPSTCAGSYSTFNRTYRTKQEMLGNYRQPNHISEIDVVEQDGKRYIYGLPVYNVKHRNVTFAISQSQGNSDNQLVSYLPGQNNLNYSEKKGKDQYYSAEEIPPYAHSFLLTGLLSSDYSDITGDGITDDDIGTAVKFNYTRLGYSDGVWNNYKWRSSAIPNSAIYNEGLKTDNSDDKASYSYGEKELWYTHSIESKTMIAYFLTLPREDGRPVLNEDGGIDDNSLKLQKLDRIEIYAKADLIKSKTNARPVKSIHFDYDYSLCKGDPSNSSGGGKLTLTKVWFQYNGSAKGAKNKYKFTYNVGAGATEFNYSQNNHDRWGNYKTKSTNPSFYLENNSTAFQSNNTDYPYAIQPTVPKSDATNYSAQKQKLDVAAGAWNLSQIGLPSGGTINVTYEADDYAYVQNKRAAQMTQIAGFSVSPPLFNSTSNVDNKLYANDAPYNECDYVYFNVTEPVTGDHEVYARYLDGINQLLMKLSIKVPHDNYSGNSDNYEFINVYAKFGKVAGTDYGFVRNLAGSTGNIIWIRMLRENGVTPVVATVFQFLKDHLPSKVFPGSDVKNDIAPVALIKAQIGALMSIGGLIGENNVFKVAHYGRTVNVTKSFCRLNNPLGFKMGGGHRVKKVVIQDNWEPMTTRAGEKETTETYGQEYEYTTTANSDGLSGNISSGVASYEPAYGAEENPFREILNYSQNHILGPTEYGAIELPLAEAFYPTAMIGYSKVRVKSIHNKTNKNIKAGTGVQETEFYTTKDFPTLSDFTLFDNKSRSHYAPSLINKFLKFWQVRHNTLSQGFRVQLNDMNGKMKAQSTYPEEHPDQPLQWTKYYYKTSSASSQTLKLNNTVDVMKDATGTISPNVTVGKDIELMVDFREHNSKAYGANWHFNFDAKFPWWFIPTVWIPVNYEESIYRSVSVMKLITSYGNLERVETFSKGSNVSTNNLVYDAETGNPILTASENLYGKPVYSFSYPAHWAYDGMGPAYKNVDVTYKNVYIRGGFIESSFVDPTLIQSGDEIYVSDEAALGQGVEPNPACAGPCATRLAKSTANKVWAVDIAKSSNNTDHRILLLERDGTPYNGAKVTIHIIRSGRRNILSASVGGFTSLANPVVNGRIDLSTPRILNASALNFKEKWKSENSFKLETSYEKIIRYVPLDSLSFRAIQTGTFMKYKKKKKFWFDDVSTSSLTNPDYFEARKNNHNNIELDSKSWALFNLSPFNGQSKITAVYLNLHSHQTSNHTYNGFVHVPPYSSLFQKHQSFNPHSLSINSAINNDLYSIKRLKTSNWVNNPNPSIFEDLYNSPDRYVDPYNGTIFKAQISVPYSLPNSKASYCANCGPFETDNRIKLDNALLKRMLIDRDDPTKNYKTAIQLDNLNYSGGNFETRLCFYSGRESGTESKAPTLDIYYYDLSRVLPAGTIPGNVKDYYTYEEYSYVSRCVSVFTKDRFNPYVYGMLGNWRSNKSYTYYGDRQQDVVNAAPVLSSDGTIKDYSSYWSFSTSVSDGLSAVTDETKWKWNSEITQFNRKGLELESKDPLGRYNAGLYGYNESLPVAVVNNAHYAESAFDGFEDYSFNDVFCSLTCQPKRHWDLGAGLNLDATQKHTGNYSVRVEAGATFRIEGAIKQQSFVEPTVAINTRTNPLMSVTLLGKGLEAKYYNSNNTSPYTEQGLVATKVDQYPSVDIPWTCFSRGFFGVKKCYVAAPPDWPGGMGVENIKVKWSGRLVVDKSGTYELVVPEVDDYTAIRIGGFPDFICTYTNSSNRRQQYTLTAGTIYDISVVFVNNSGPGKMRLLWRTPCSNTDVSIPMKNLYSPYGTISGISSVMMPCEPSTIQASDNLVDKFELSLNKKMVISGWVKEGSASANSVISYTHNTGTVSFQNISGSPIGSSVPIRYTGNIIDGWQQFEAVFTTPQVSGSVEYQYRLSFQNTSSGYVYYDDLRIHPFNANMKSFVYDPVTLRLTAELDENNFASFYEYDDEGTLTRTKKETKEGVKTIQETRSSLLQNP